MVSTKRKIINILMSSAISTVFCQICMALTCISSASVMHMPTVKNTLFVLAIAVFISIGTDVFLNYIITYTRKTATGIAILALFLLMAVITSLLNPIKSADGLVAYRYPMIAAICFGVLLYQLILKKLKPVFECNLKKPDFTKPEVAFAAIALIFGIIICVAIPATTTICIDDETHYKDTLILSEGIYTAYNEDDADLIYRWDKSRDKDNHEGLLYVDANPRGFLPNKIGYISPTLGLWTGRILNLNINGIYFCGRLSGLFIYVVVIYFAIKRLVNGKIALGIICASPIAIQYAVGYSYDAWLLAFTSLSLTYYLGARQRPDEKLSSREMIIIIGSMLIGTLTKTPYAVMFLILMFMPKAKFTDSKSRRCYYICILICIIFEMGFTIATSFGLGDVADTRGGDDVSAYGQIAYIINNPKEFMETFSEWLKNYLVPVDSWDFLTRFGFYENSGVYLTLVIAICISALIDNEIRIADWTTRIAGLVIVLILVSIIGILMYLAFTSVGEKTIQGAQTRYKLQLLFPFAMFLLSGYIVPEQKYVKCWSVLAYCASTFCLIMTIVSII